MSVSRPVTRCWSKEEEEEEEEEEKEGGGRRSGPMTTHLQVGSIFGAVVELVEIMTTTEGLPITPYYYSPHILIPVPQPHVGLELGLG